MILSITGAEGRGADIKACLDRITPADLTSHQVIEEIYLFTPIYGLHEDESLRQHFISQAIPSVDKVYSAFLRVSVDRKTKAKIESVNAASMVNCYCCLGPSHVAKLCPHAEALDKVVSQHNANYANRKDKGKWSKPCSQEGDSGNATASANAATATTSSNTTNASSSAPTPSHESAGVATYIMVKVKPPSLRQ